MNKLPNLILFFQNGFVMKRIELVIFLFHIMKESVLKEEDSFFAIRQLSTVTSASMSDPDFVLLIPNLATVGMPF